MSVRHSTACSASCPGSDPPEVPPTRVQGALGHRAYSGFYGACWARHPAGVDNALHHPLHRRISEKLVALRHAEGLSQRELAERLDVTPNFVARLELGERKVDVLELFWICEALDVDPLTVFERWWRRFEPAVDLRSAGGKVIVWTARGASLG